MPPIVLVITLALAIAGDSSAEDRPNVVLIVVDDLGYGELGCQGNPEIPTPRIDSIAAEGVRFTNGYVTASYCSPSRAGLLTGRDQNRFGCDANPVGARNDEPGVGLPPTERTIAAHLKTAGYATGLVGKWHLGGRSPHHPLRLGFDEFFGFRHEGHYYAPSPYDGMVTWLRRRHLPDGSLGRWIRPDGRLILTTHMGHDEPPYDADNPILRGGQPADVPFDLTDSLSREAESFIRRHADRPFFLTLSYNAIHSPMQASVEDVERFRHIDDIHRRIFAAMLHRLDEGVGRVLDTLQDEELDERTLVVFLSDNGGATRELTSSNLPLRGGKGDLFEGGIRVPFLARWPGRIPEGSVIHEPITTLDLFPTLSAAAGLPTPSDRPIDGRDLLPVLVGSLTDPPSGLPAPFLWWRMGMVAAQRSGDWKIVRDRRQNPDAGWQLFDLADDRSESVDLATDRPDIVQELVRSWEARNAEMAPPSSNRP